jgi:DNA-binding NarL/FixJ family response regulator
VESHPEGGDMELQAIRVLVVDDDDFTRTLVASLVTSLGYEVAAMAASVNEAMACSDRDKPGLALLDLDLGEGPTGIDLAHGLRKLNPSIAIVMLTSYRSPTWMGQHREPPVGARYVVKNEVNNTNVLADALTSAVRNPRLADGPARSVLPLSEGQWEVLRLVAAGYTNSEIARRRSLTEDAVNKAVSRLVRQLELEVGSSGNARVLLTQAFNRMTGTVSERRD